MGEVLMDDISLSNAEFHFKKFKVDEVSIDEAVDDICFYANNVFEKSLIVKLFELKYNEGESTKALVHYRSHAKRKNILPVYFGYAIVKRFSRLVYTNQ